MSHPVSLMLSRPQMRRLVQSKVIQLRPNDIGNPNGIKINVDSRIARKLERAHRAGRGCRIQLSQDLVQGSGIFDWLRDAGKWIKSNIIDKPFYQSVIKPVVKGAVDTGLSAVSAAVPQARPLADEAARIISERTGAFGLQQERGGGVRRRRRRGGALEEGTAGNPGPYPDLPYLDRPVPSNAPHALDGGSFRIAGGAAKKPWQIKGSVEAREHMAKLRAMRARGGSFR